MSNFNLPQLPQKQVPQQQRILSPVHNMGKVPPQAVDLEKGIIGSILYDSDSFVEVADILKPEHFYSEVNKKIMEAVFSLFTAGEPIDELTVVQKLRKLGTLELVGGAYAITEISHNGSRAGQNIEEHARLLIQMAMKRGVIRVSTEAVQNAYDDTVDIFDLIEKNQVEIYNILSDTHKKKGRDITELMKDSLIKMMEPMPDGLTGVGTSFTELDAITGGWQPSDLIIVAARPAMGKTAFIIECASNASEKFNKPTAVFSLEMSSLQLTNRLISSKTGVKLEKILKRNVSDVELSQMQDVITKIDSNKLIIDDSPGLSIVEFRAKCRRLKNQYDIQLIIIDYLQLMHSGEKNGNRDAEIGAISRALKTVAKELNVPIIALSQLSRAVESRASKRPMLSDLRESGNIEQDADMVIFLHRPEYYGVTEDAHGKSTIGLCETIIAKHRNGICETVKLDFNGSLMRFKDWNPYVTTEVQTLPTLQFGVQTQILSYSQNITSDEPPF